MRASLVATLTVVLAGVPLVAPAANAGPPTCEGEKATIVGTTGPDTLEGTSKRDVMVGLAGDDVLYGRGGDKALSELAPLNPVTPYGESKIQVERALSALADDTFSPT